MNERYVDTSGWAAYICSDEQHHTNSVRAITEVWDAHSKLITSTYVLAELTALLIRLRVPRPEQVEVIDQIMGDSSVEVISVEPDFATPSWSLWRTRLDKGMDAGRLHEFRHHA